MRWLWWAVPSVVSVSFFVPAVELQAEGTDISYKIVRVREEHPTRVAVASTSNLTTRDISKPTSSQNRPARIRDLLPKDLYEKLGSTAKPDPLHIEPWVPGRGAVGVRVELTW